MSLKVDFYILAQATTQEALLFACRLVDKAYQSGHQVFILLDNQTQAFAFDENLWEFDPQSFIPHHIQGEGPLPPPPVQIGYTLDQPPKIKDVLINLSGQVPQFYHQFKRICEIVANDENQKAIKREHYRFYQKIQAKIHTHQV